MPTAAVWCQTGVQVASDGTSKSVDLERGATEVAPLLTYLRRPSLQMTNPDGLTCPAMAWSPPWLFLLDDHDRWILPVVPTDACGFALDLFSEAGPAYRHLDYRDRVVKR